MVPDVSGIDKVFDYIVPEGMLARVGVGDRVRVSLNGRRVSGWVVALGPSGTVGDTTLDVGRLSEIVAVSGQGVVSELVPLTRWLADYFFGTWRAALSRASAPRVRPRHVHQRINSTPSLVSDVAEAAESLVALGGGLCVVPPVASALQVVTAMASHGGVLVVCPTQRMAILGAASLRRQGLSTALVPDDWDAAREGVNVVIGARSAVFAPCHNLKTIVVIDEHDELHHDERAPTWNSIDVAQERARRADVPCILTSACPSPESIVTHADRIATVTKGPQWPNIVVEDLANVPVSGSLLSSSLLDAVKDLASTTVCVLNTKGKARLLVCKACGVAQKCPICASLLSQEDNNQLRCVRCSEDRGGVCVSCGRTTFAVPRGGVSHLISQLQRSTDRPLIEITSDTDDNWNNGSVYVGTEAALYRIPSAATVVFADIDRDLLAPRITAVREVVSLVIRAARIVGSGGRVIIQTRSPDHPLLAALASDDVASRLMEWNKSDVASRRMFGLPPFAHMAHLALSSGETPSSSTDGFQVRIASVADGVLVSASTRDELGKYIAQNREQYGTQLRVHADPTRY